MIPNTDERIPRRAFQPHVPRIRTRCTTISPIRACMRLCACTQGGKDGRGRPEGLSEVRTVHYPRSRTPLRLFDSFPLAHPCVHRPRPSSTDPRARWPPSLFSLGLSLYSRISSRDAATHRSFSPFWNAATSRNIVALDAGGKEEHRAEEREWRRRRRRKGYREKIATREMLHEAAPRWGRSIQWLVISQRDFRGNGQLCYARQGMIHTPLRLGKLEEMLLLFTEMYLERNSLVEEQSLIHLFFEFVRISIRRPDSKKKLKLFYSNFVLFVFLPVIRGFADGYRLEHVGAMLIKGIFNESSRRFHEKYSDRRGGCVHIRSCRCRHKRMTRS